MRRGGRMRSSIMIAIKKIKKKKFQSILIGIIIASSALLFSTAVGIMLSMNGPIEKMFKDSKSSHDLFLFSSRFYDSSNVQNWWNSQSGVDMTQMYNQLVIGTNIKANGKKTSFQFNFLCEMPKDKGDIDNFKMIKGNEVNSPGDGEVWINTGFASTDNVKLGDTLSIGDRNYKISGIIVDTEFSSTMLGMQRYWVKQGELDKYSEYKNNPCRALAIRYKNPSSSDSTWSSFQKYLNGPLVGTKVQYSNIYSCYSTILKYTGVFMLFFSIIIIIIAVFIIKFVISNSIYRDYKNIGIYKALGFSSESINFIYVAQYFMISLVSVIAGILLSKFTIDKIITSNFKILGMDSTRASYAVPFVSTFVVMIFLIALSSYLSALKTNKIKPVEAMRETNESSTVHGGNIERKLFMKFPVSIAMGIKSLIRNKRSALLIFISVFITLYAGLSGINLLHTSSAVGRNMGYWGFDNSMVDIKPNVNDKKLYEDVENDVKNDKNVKCFTQFLFYQDVSFLNKKGNIEKLLTAQIVGDNSGKLGFMNMEGRSPQKKNEVSLSVNTARTENKHVGDYVKVYIKNKEYNLLVVGIYQSLNSMGRGMRLYNGTISEADPDYIPEILLNLKDGSSISSYINEMESKYGEKINVVKRQGEFDDQMKLMTQGSFASVAMIVAIMLSICFLNIFNITLMNINEERKNCGIYKAIGMTSGEIRNSIIFKTFLIFIAALIISLPFVIKATPALMSLIFINVGIANYPVSIALPNMVIMAAVCFVFSILSAYMASGIINKINLRSLIEE